MSPHGERQNEPAGSSTTGSEQGRDLGFDLPPPARITPSRATAVVLATIALLIGIFLLAWLPKQRAQRDLKTNAAAAETALLRVQVVAPKPKSSDRSLLLPGSVQALEETTLYPRASGYVRNWNKDIGDHVKEGDVLAEIDTPEIDQQLDQARAQLGQAQAGLAQATANRDFSTTTLNRYKELAPTGVASQQELDQKVAQSTVDEANVKVAKAAIEAQQANLRRLVQLKSFSRVLAPFAGRVTSRTIERGALVSPTSALFKVSATDTVRVIVQVPQDVAPSVRADMPARVSAREYPERHFEGKIAHAAGALDPASRTMNTEVRVPNPNNELLVGMYVEVALSLPSPHRVLELPATTIMNDANGMRVARVVDDTIHLIPVVIERDTGSTVEIASGIAEGDRIVRLGSAELTPNRRVQIVP